MLLSLLLLLFFNAFPSSLPAPIAYYSFDGCNARDLTGNGSDGELFGDIECWCGVDNDGLLFDGAGDYLEFSGPVNRYFSTSDFTVSFYFRSDGYSVFPTSMLSKREACNEEHLLDIHLDLRHQEIGTELRQSEHRYFRELAPEYGGAGWWHYALVREGRYAYTYINGKLAKKSVLCSGVDITNEAVLSFGNSPCIRGGRMRPFQGVLDELRVYDQALNEEQVLELYNKYPVENAETDCLSFLDKKMHPQTEGQGKSLYLCGNWILDSACLPGRLLSGRQGF